MKLPGGNFKIGGAQVPKIAVFGAAGLAAFLFIRSRQGAGGGGAVTVGGAPTDTSGTGGFASTAAGGLLEQEQNNASNISSLMQQLQAISGSVASLTNTGTPVGGGVVPPATPWSSFVIGTNKVAGGFGIYGWDPTKAKWARIPGGGVSVWEDTAGDPWLINSAGAIFQYNPKTSKWDLRPGSAAVPSARNP